MSEAAAPVDRGFEYWTPQPLWRGETCFLLGGGPSLNQATVDRLRGHRVMAINSSCLLAAGIAAAFDALFFTDNSWFEPRRRLVEAWPGLVFTLARGPKAALPDKVKRLEIDTWTPDFPPSGAPKIRQGRSSGHTAISIAVALGAARIVLLGYDMQIVGGRSHHHAEYHERDPGLYAADFVPAFAGWNAAVLRAGAEVVNATPGSALKEFPFAALDDVLAPAKVAA